MHTDVVTDGRTQLSGGGKAGPFQGVPAEFGEPDFYLVEPRGVSGCVVELHVLMLLQLLVMFGFVDVQVVQDHVDFAVAMAGDDLVHEGKKFHASTALGVLCLHFASHHIQGRKQV